MSYQIPCPTLWNLFKLMRYTLIKIPAITKCFFFRFFVDFSISWEKGADWILNMRVAFLIDKFTCLYTNRFCVSIHYHYQQVQIWSREFVYTVIYTLNLSHTVNSPKLRITCFFKIFSLFFRLHRINSGYYSINLPIPIAKSLNKWLP